MKISVFWEKLCYTSGKDRERLVESSVSGKLVLAESSFWRKVLLEESCQEGMFGLLKRLVGRNVVTYAKFVAAE